MLGLLGGILGEEDSMIPHAANIETVLSHRGDNGGVVGTWHQRPPKQGEKNI